MFHLRLIFLLFIVTIPATLFSAEYVGVNQCKTCHQKEYNLWQGSHHDMAMKHADNDSVLGDFNNVSLKLSATTSRFYKKDNQYWVNIEGPDGVLHDYHIKYTFGYKPLQQYMVEFENGRMQLIPFAWDSRNKQQGGQRWFNLYPEFTKKYQEFYWTNTGQNWNYMCADCHSTNVNKNFNVKNNTYNTTWSEINVACEACHGPASEHIKWTKNKNGNIGFTRDLSKPVKKWLNKENKATLQAESKSKRSTQQSMMCGQCHSRHTQISNNDYLKTNQFGDRYILNLISSDNYHADGQVDNENYVYGSFLQSKMYKNGVTCSNCHDPHSGKLVLPKETLCLQCHKEKTYSSVKHHHHPEKSDGAQCVNCHMPETTYMKIDKRADHGWHIPRPDLSVKMGTPDTCLSCHTTKNSQWSDKHVNEWYPNSKIDKKLHFANTFSIADIGYPQASVELTKISQNKNYSAIIRGSALSRMENFPDKNSFISIARAVKDKDELIRLGAIQGSQNMPQTERWKLLEPLLSDDVLSIRVQTASVLASLWQGLNEKQKETLRPALDEYLEIQDFNADRGFAHTNRGNVLVYMGLYSDALKAYDNSIRIEPGFSTAYVNKADLYRQLNKEKKLIETLKKGMEAQPEGADLYYSYGLSLIRSNEKTVAIDYLKKASELDPNNANYKYVYALSLIQTQPEQAQVAMYETYQLSKNPRHLYVLCEMQIKQKSFQARQCLSRLEKLVPPGVINDLKEMLSKSEKLVN